MKSPAPFDVFSLQPATLIDISEIWAIIQQAILKRKEEGSEQWQNGYPNEDVIQNDIRKNDGWVLVRGTEVIAYVALIFDGEPAYENIEGKWLSHQPYACVHRMAVKQLPGIKGLATHIMQQVEQICLEKGIYSIKIDTNFDNAAMLRIIEKLQYTYCGEVFYQGKPRKAFEKCLR